MHTGSGEVYAEFTSLLHRHSFGSSGIPSVCDKALGMSVRAYKLSDFSQTKTHLKKR